MVTSAAYIYGVALEIVWSTYFFSKILQIIASFDKSQYPCPWIRTDTFKPWFQSNL